MGTVCFAILNINNPIRYFTNVTNAIIVPTLSLNHGVLPRHEVYIIYNARVHYLKAISSCVDQWYVCLLNASLFTC